MSNKCLSQDCKEKALSLSQYCWKHIEDKDAYRKLLSEHIKEYHSIKELYLRHLEFHGAQWHNIDAEGVDLAGADLSFSDLTAVNFKNANLTGANLQKTDLASSDLEKAHLLRCNLSNARLWYAVLKETNLAESDLEGTDFLKAAISGVKFWHIRLKDAQSLTRHNFKGPRPIDEKGALSASEAYRSLKQYFIASGRYDDASWASFKEMELERVYLFGQRQLAYIPSLLMAVLCGYREKPFRVTLSSLGIIFGYGILYYFLNVLKVPEGYNLIRLNIWDNIYFSVVTFTTLGFGDLTIKIVPLFQALVGSEAFIGAFMMGLFVFTLSRRYSAR